VQSTITTAGSGHVKLSTGEIVEADAVVSDGRSEDNHLVVC